MDCQMKSGANYKLVKPLYFQEGWEANFIIELSISTIFSEFR